MSQSADQLTIDIVIQVFYREPSLTNLLLAYISTCVLNFLQLETVQVLPSPRSNPKRKIPTTLKARGDVSDISGLCKGFAINTSIST